MFPFFFNFFFLQNLRIEIVDNLVAGDRCLSLKGILRGDWCFGEVAKSRSRGLNQKATREESVIEDNDDLGELEETSEPG